MRIVRHPNIVELKAFYYSNGERVSDWNQKLQVPSIELTEEWKSRKTRST